MYRGKLKTYKVGKTTLAEPEPQRPTLFGHVLEVKFEFEGHQFWACADYYLESEGTYLVSYKVGMVDSWFATSFEYGVFFDDIHIECSEDEIVDILRQTIELKKEYAAKRYLKSVYTFMHWCDNPKHQPLLAHALAFVTISSDAKGVYVPFEGVRRSVLVRMKGNLYYCGHFNADGTSLQLFGTETDAEYIRVGDVAISTQDENTIERLLYEYNEMYFLAIHPTIQILQMDTVADAETLTPDWEQAVAPYMGKEIELWPEF